MRPFALSAAVFAATALSQNKGEKTECADGLYMIAVRGTGEDKGSGRIGEIAEDVSKRVNGSIVSPLDYPATLQDPDYFDSEEAGVKALSAALDDYHSSCPNGKIAVFGYSQGGQVATDVFCGGSDNKPLTMSLVKDSVVAVIAFGDPSHVANLTYDRGTSKNDGIFERPSNETKLCEDNYSDIIRSYCDTGDVYCDVGKNNETHGSYFEKYGKEVVDFVVERYEKALKDESTSTQTSTAAATAEASSSATASDAPSATTAAPGNAAAGLVPGLVLAMIPLALAVSEYL
ncbi:Acetylxylan esterase 2 [Fusarium oxysporum f. sp. cubense race 1]|uniref:Acetylxylan esterase 2 n=1 Tax=Fusarium oxysporum f. sp. cubense (strain race 1) TaxID=1229664 RepID=N4UIL0_FUSC1|nr:Acetylxylan esterase 2 [Fusarium oxysporum f. sp. cubense race 1]